MLPTSRGSTPNSAQHRGGEESDGPRPKFPGSLDVIDTTRPVKNRKITGPLTRLAASSTVHWAAARRAEIASDGRESRCNQSRMHFGMMRISTRFALQCRPNLRAKRCTGAGLKAVPARTDAGCLPQPLLRHCRALTPQVGFTRLAARSNAELGQARVPLQSISFSQKRLAKKMDPRVKPEGDAREWVSAESMRTGTALVRPLRHARFHASTTT